MPEFATEFLSRYEREPEEMHDTAVFAQPFYQSIEVIKRGGESITQRFTLRGPRGFANSLENAQQISAVKKNSEYFRFLTGYGRALGSIRIPHEDITHANADPEYGADLLEKNVDSGVAGFAQDLVFQIFGPAGGNFGTATFHSAASAPYPVFALRFADPSLVAHCQTGDQIEIATDDGTSTGWVRTGQVGIVIDRDVDNGYLQVAALSDPTTAANPGGWDATGATTYYVFRLGMAHKGVPEDIVVGMSYWMPDTRQTSVLFGVNRALDSALSGQRLLTSEAVGTIARRAKRLTSKTKARLGNHAAEVGRGQNLYLNPEEWDILEDQENSRVVNPRESTVVNGYKSIKIQTAIGELDCVPEPAQPKGRARLISPKVCKFVCPSGKLVAPVNIGYGITHPIQGSNDAEIKPFYYGQFIMGPPHAHGSFATTG